MILCDGTVAFLSGAGTGIAGWSSTPLHMSFADGTQVDCAERCTKADRDAADGHWQHNEPVIFGGASWG